VRWIRLLWPEMVFGGMWIALLCLGHTVFTDDEMWQHAAIDALEWCAFFGYVIAVAIAYVRPSADTVATD